MPGSARFVSTTARFGRPRTSGAGPRNGMAHGIPLLAACACTDCTASRNASCQRCWYALMTISSPFPRRTPTTHPAEAP